MQLATSSPERQRENVLTAAASVGAHIIGWADDWEVSGATDPMTRPNLGPWLRDERVPYDGLVAAAVDRLGRNVVICLNTGYKMRDEKKMLVTYGHEGARDLDDSADENRFTMEAWGAQKELRAIQRGNRDATVRTRAAAAPEALTARFRRKQLLVVGWLLGIPAPFAPSCAPSWGWIVAANVLLGLNQGLTWSMTVNMKIDRVGPARRGLATGLNEAAGYTAVGVTSLLTVYLATGYGLRPVPELIGVIFVAAGLALTLAVRDTAAHVALELANHTKPLPTDEDTGVKATFTRTSWRNRSLRGASQAGLIKGICPILRGIGQIPTGHFADRIGRKPLIVSGMLVQAVGFDLTLALLDTPLLAGILCSAFLGLGTAMVYPALIASVSDHAHPAWRANALGSYRFWRDIGYAAGALVVGVLADALGLNATVIAAVSGLLAARWITGHRPDTR
ncbi:MFS transporter [Streptomyces koyangensis]|uniref:MFS transporter n=1 Tax=Streptomyces koyangensis TaxID=188770 RepID=UPI003C2B6BEA